VKHQLSNSAEPPRGGEVRKLCFLKGGGACLLPQDKKARRLGLKNTSLLDGLRSAHAAACDAVLLKVAGRVGGAGGLTGRTNVAGTFGTELPTDAHLTVLTRVEATLHLRTRWATSLVVERVALTTERPAALADEVGLAIRQLTAPETVAAVGHQRQTGLEASGVLLAVQSLAIEARALCGIVFAARFTAGRVSGRHRLCVAFVAPLALVVADTAVSVEIAVLLARRRLHGHHARAQAVLVVVARAQAIRIECIDDAVAVVISAVAALKKLTPALRLHARRRAALARGNATVARAATDRKRTAST